MSFFFQIQNIHITAEPLWRLPSELTSFFLEYQSLLCDEQTLPACVGAVPADR